MSDYRPLVEIPHARSETARRYRFDDGVGEIGIIAPVSHPFCGHCSRIRITSDGKIRTCLFSVWDHDLHAQMRRGANDDDLAEFIQGVIQKKEQRHHIGEPDFVPASRTLVHIGVYNIRGFRKIGKGTCSTRAATPRQKVWLQPPRFARLI